jgi:hypothetical protein
MVTIQEALTEYNKQHGTTYVTITDLGTDLVKAVLREAWRAKRMNEAHETAVAEGGAL